MCDERIVKSEIYCGEISRSISTSGEKPTPPFDGLIEQVSNAAIKAKEFADRAEAAAERAENAGGSGGGIVEETDPTVPDWAKQPEPPTYNAGEVGAMPSDAPAVLYTQQGLTGEQQEVARGNIGAASQEKVRQLSEEKADKKDIPAPYTLPTASAEVKGGVKVGEGLTMTDGVLSVSEGVYELIETIVVEESVAQFARNVEPSGAPYNFKALIVFINATTEGSSTSIYFQHTKTGANILRATLGSPLENSYAFARAYLCYGAWCNETSSYAKEKKHRIQ